MLKKTNQSFGNGLNKRQRQWQRKRTMQFGTWNVQGLLNKINEVTHEIRERNVDVALITETKKKGQGSENLGHYDHFFSGVPKQKRAQQGVSILIRKKFRKYIKTWEAINSRIIKMNLDIWGYRMTILGIYGVNDDATVKIKDDFYEQINDEIRKIGTSREIIVLGDLNGRVGKNTNNIAGPYGEDNVNDNGNRIITFCDNNNLKILNGFYQHKDTHKYTWTQKTRNLRSIIDYAIIRQKTRLKVQDIRVYRGASCGSDHYLLKSKILFHSSKRNHNDKESQEDEGTEYKIRRYNLVSLDHESTKNLYKTRLKDKLNREDFSSTEDHYEYIKKCIHEAATESLGTYEDNTNKNKPYWWNSELETEITNKKKMYQIYLTTNSA